MSDGEWWGRPGQPWDRAKWGGQPTAPRNMGHATVHEPIGAISRVEAPEAVPEPPRRHLRVLPPTEQPEPVVPPVGASVTVSTTEGEAPEPVDHARGVRLYVRALAGLLDNLRGDE